MAWNRLARDAHRLFENLMIAAPNHREQDEMAKRHFNAISFVLASAELLAHHITLLQIEEEELNKEGLIK